MDVDEARSELQKAIFSKLPNLSQASAAQFASRIEALIDAKMEMRPDVMRLVREVAAISGDQDVSNCIEAAKEILK